MPPLDPGPLDPTRDPSVPPDDDNPPRIRWRVVVQLIAASFVLRFAYFYLDDLTRQQTGTFLRRLLEEGTGHITSLLLFPVVAFAERRFPMDRGRWRRHLAPHLGVYVVFSAIHTTLIALSREVLFPALGLGDYDYGLLSVRYFMEAAQDVFAYLTFLGILTFVRVQHRLRQRELRAVELERDAANARLAALSARLQPHFLFNALNTISSTVYEDPVAADEMIGRLGILLRRALHSRDRHEVRLDEELETLHAYLAFVVARFGERLSVQLDVDPSALGAAVPALLLQPLVENAVRHGSGLDRGESGILIEVTRRDGQIVVVVENDTDGAPATPRVGTGLGTTRDRLRLLYGDAAHLDATRIGERFRVTARWPARELAPSPAPNIAAPETEHARADR